jgi:hypothetical protein
MSSTTCRFAHVLVLAAVFPTIAAAQSTPADPYELGSAPSQYFEIQEQLAQWREAHGESWQVVFDSQTGYASFLFGGATQALSQPRAEADYFVLARNALLTAQSIHGLDLGTLTEERATFLPLGNAGSTDKLTVHFRQEVNGVRVLGGYANVLFDMQGRVLSVDSTGLPNLAGFSTKPAIDSGAAIDAALSLFTTDTGLPPTAVGTPELVIDQQLAGESRVGKLAWQIDVLHASQDSEPEGYSYRIDALHGGLLGRRSLIHNFDVSGTVRSMATTTLAPDGAGNPEQQVVMPYLRVNSAQGNAVTDLNGNFTIVGATAPLQVTVTYDGTYCSTSNQAQADYSLSTMLNAAAGNAVLMNPASNDLVTAEANALNWIGLMRNWTRSVNPADATSDFLAQSNPNINSTCNAYYDGGSVNFYLSGGGCANTAYSTVVLHEMGHWLNDRYSSGNGPDGFGEGNADNFATHITDNPIVGLNFCGAGCHVRDANNNRQFCGDNNGGCYGGVHADGEVLMGALWKVRTRLKNGLGAAAGVVASNTLFNAWMNAYNDSQIKTIIETHYLTLDDNDGNINNGTPNYLHIDGGFKQQGFPGFALSFVTYSNVTVLGNTTNEAGPYVVNADILATFNPPIVNPQLFYRVDGGAYQAVAMSPTGGSGYTGSIPGQTSPAKVEYYLSANDSTAQSNSFPAAGGAAPLKFSVGILTTYFTTNFESGIAGWTHGSPNGTQDDWQHSSTFGVNGSFGQSGDPSSAASGTNIWGNDLGSSGWNGAYSNSVSNWLRSPAINLSQASGSRLLLKRWLTVQNSNADKATIKINGQQVYINPPGGDLIDTSWQDVEIDISAIADGNPSVQIEFGMVTNGSTAFGGWNIDDVEISSLTSVCPPPTNYCVSKMTSALSVPIAGFTGSPSVSAGNFTVTLMGAIPNTNAAVVWSPNQASTPFGGGTLCLGPPLTRGPAQITSGTGTLSFSPTLLPSMAGTSLNYQWWFRDTADPFKLGLSDAIHTTFCN